MEEKTVIRVKPRTFEEGWREDFLAVGVTVSSMKRMFSWMDILPGFWRRTEESARILWWSGVGRSSKRLSQVCMS